MTIDLPKAAARLPLDTITAALLVPISLSTGIDYHTLRTLFSAVGSVRHCWPQN